jgi:NADP-dependent 3-hydroxy acid dehydrogenase YdfG
MAFSLAGKWVLITGASSGFGAAAAAAFGALRCNLLLGARRLDRLEAAAAAARQAGAAQALFIRWTSPKQPAWRSSPDGRAPGPARWTC